MCGEFVGTVLFLYFALSGAQVANSIPSSAGLTVAQTGSNPQQLQYIALCFGFSLAVNAWVFFRISGGLFNPAVTLGMCLIGALPWVRGVLLFIAQILGGLAAAGLVSCMFPGALNVQTNLGGGTSITQGLFIEMILTAQVRVGMPPLLIIRPLVLATRLVTDFCAARLHDLHAGRREAQRHLHCTSRYGLTIVDKLRLEPDRIFQALGFRYSSPSLQESTTLAARSTLPDPSVLLSSIVDSTRITGSTGSALSLGASSLQDSTNSSKCWNTRCVYQSPTNTYTYTDLLLSIDSES